jgi:hypothetical protein
VTFQCVCVSMWSLGRAASRRHPKPTGPTHAHASQRPPARIHRTKTDKPELARTNDFKVANPRTAWMRCFRKVLHSDSIALLICGMGVVLHALKTYKKHQASQPQLATRRWIQER